jgi:hypothetical protein
MEYRQSGSAYISVWPASEAVTLRTLKYSTSEVSIEEQNNDMGGTCNMHRDMINSYTVHQGGCGGQVI